MKECIGEVLNEMLKDHTYKQDEAPELTKQIADRVKNSLKLLELPRYKYMVQVVVGEQRGEGVRMGCRTFWDRDTDGARRRSRTTPSSASRRPRGLPELSQKKKSVSPFQSVLSRARLESSAAHFVPRTLRARSQSTEERHCSASNAAMDFARVEASMAKSHNSPMPPWSDRLVVFGRSRPYASSRGAVAGMA